MDLSIIFNTFHILNKNEPSGRSDVCPGSLALGWRELGWFSKDGSDSPKAEGSQGTLRWSRLESFVVVVLSPLQVDFSKEVFQEHQDACDLAGCWKSSSLWLTCCSDHCAYCEKYKCWMWRWRSKVMRMLAFGTHFQTQRSLLSVPKNGQGTRRIRDQLLQLHWNIPGFRRACNFSPRPVMLPFLMARTCLLSTV